MKKLIEETGEGAMESLMGEVITIFSLNYIYTGKLVGVNDTCCLLENPKIVYETGSFDTKEWSDAQALPNDLYVQYACIESFGVVK
jgi:hypothetical protein